MKQHSTYGNGVKRYQNAPESKGHSGGRRKPGKASIREGECAGQEIEANVSLLHDSIYIKFQVKCFFFVCVCGMMRCSRRFSCFRSNWSICCREKWAQQSWRSLTSVAVHSQVAVCGGAGRCSGLSEPLGCTGLWLHLWREIYAYIHSSPRSLHKVAWNRSVTW